MPVEEHAGGNGRVSVEVRSKTRCKVCNLPPQLLEEAHRLHFAGLSSPEIIHEIKDEATRLGLDICLLNREGLSQHFQRHLKPERSDSTEASFPKGIPKSLTIADGAGMQMPAVFEERIKLYRRILERVDENEAMIQEYLGRYRDRPNWEREIKIGEMRTIIQIRNDNIKQLFNMIQLDSPRAILQHFVSKGLRSAFEWMTQKQIGRLQELVEDLPPLAQDQEQLSGAIRKAFDDIGRINRDALDKALYSFSQLLESA